MKMKKIGPGGARPKFYYVDQPLYSSSSVCFHFLFLLLHFVSYYKEPRIYKEFIVMLFMLSASVAQNQR